MGSEGDGRDNESDQSGSQFGPPVGDFGPPVGDFGPPVGDFGPPMDDFGPPTAGRQQPWQVPEPATDHPELAWRPADEPPTAPPPAQYRAPETTVFPDGPPPPAPTVRHPQLPVDSDDDLTVRHPVAPQTGQRDEWWNRPTDSGGVPTPPEPSPRSESESLSWADDPIAKRLAPSKAIPTPDSAPARQSATRGRWIVLGGVGAVVVVVALVVSIVAVNRGGGSGSDKAAPPPVPLTTTTPELSCPAGHDGKITVGNGVGDTATGPGAILGFQHAFYVERNGERARQFVAPDAENVSAAEVIQQAINDQIPTGTTHCLRITELGPEHFEVDLTENRPDGSRLVYRQSVTTANRDGSTLVFSIKERT
ncbi:hypothetical protein [Nocardia australiensis]|uniref:hypothetical protein n=1 Tax=Nocardia australiensis TaxID=2887191 RepID=UPI001D142D65|nr:hypothetical protein [Nocardia australiensis]